MPAPTTPTRTGRAAPGIALNADAVLIARITGDLAAVARAEIAPGMADYMKSDMPFLGVRLPLVRQITRVAEQERPPTDLAVHVATVCTLWDRATHREHRYAALSLLNSRAARTLRSLPMVEVYEYVIATGQWWDYVDEVSHRVGDLLRLHPTPMTQQLRTWAVDSDFWLRRSAIIAQLGHRDATDVELLADVIVANLAEREFFVRKAIGWALREYARTDPEWVRRFVAQHEATLSPLSRREALKHL